MVRYDVVCGSEPFMEARDYHDLEDNDEITENVIQCVLHVLNPNIPSNIHLLHSAFVNSYEHASRSADDAGESAQEFALTAPPAIFTREYVLVPYTMHSPGSTLNGHHVLIVMNMLTCTWMVYNSLGRGPYPEISKIIRSLAVLWSPRSWSQWTYREVRCGQQRDGVSCGLHTIANILDILGGGKLGMECLKDPRAVREYYLGLLGPYVPNTCVPSVSQLPGHRPDPDQESDSEVVEELFGPEPSHTQTSSPFSRSSSPTPTPSKRPFTQLPSTILAPSESLFIDSRSTTPIPFHPDRPTTLAQIRAKEKERREMMLSWSPSPTSSMPSIPLSPFGFSTEWNGEYTIAVAIQQQYERMRDFDGVDRYRDVEMQDTEYDRFSRWLATPVGTLSVSTPSVEEAALRPRVRRPRVRRMQDLKRTYARKW